MNAKLRSLITQARLVSGSPNSAPSVVTAMLARFRSTIIADDEMLDAILSDGLNQAVRAALKTAHGADAKATAQLRFAQLEQWPAHCRAFVKDIDREAVFVPSRGEHVELVPDALTKNEIQEAGHYLISQGRDCIARGNSLLRLAESLDARAPEAA